MRRLALLLPLLAFAASARDSATNAIPHHAGLAFGAGFADARWSWPEETTVIDGVVVSLGYTCFEAHNGLGIGLGAQWSDDSLNGLHLSLVQHDAMAMRGVQIAGVLNSGRCSEGVVVAGLSNMMREGCGIQLSVFNGLCPLMPPRTEAYADYYAWFDGLNYRGVQAALGSNAASCMEGIQIAGIANTAFKVTGVQLATVFNFAEELHGLQLGILNRAHGGTGVQIGLVNGFGPPDDTLWLPLLNARF